MSAGLALCLAASLAFAQTSAAALTSQTITFAAPSNKTFGNAPFTVSASASSGLAVSFSSLTTPVCTASGNTVTIVAAGSCTIRASQAGDATYAPAPNVDRTLTVAKANQTITFATLGNKTVDAPPFAVSGSASSGLAVSFSSATTPVCAVSGNTVTIVASGTCTIQASQAGNGNFNAATNVNRSFTVTKVSQTITFAPLSGKKFGDASFTVGASASSGLPVSFASLTASVCTVSGNTVTIVAVGTCNIQASQRGDATYAAAPNVSRGFAVAKASQTITFDAPSSNRALGSGPFTIGATASSGLAVTFISLTTPVCTMSGSTVTMVALGICTIQAKQAGSASYSAAPNVSQSFVVTVGLQSQTITFEAPSNITLGDWPNALSATASSGLLVSFVSLTMPVCTVNGHTPSIVAAGICTIQAQQPGNASYASAPNVNQSFTVAKRGQTITFGALGNHALGDPPFTVSATASSFLPVSFSALTPAVCSVSGATATVVAAGTCTVRASQPGNAVFAPAPNLDQSFTVAGGVQYLYDGVGNLIGIQRN